MSKTKRLKQSKEFVAVDQTGHNKVDDVHEEVKSDYESSNRAKKMKKKKKDKKTDTLPAIDIDESDPSNNDDTMNSRNVKKKRLDRKMKNKVNIDSENCDEEEIVVEESIKASSKKRKESSSSQKTSKRKKLKEDDVNEAIDVVIEFESSNKTKRKHKDPDKLRRRAKVKNEDEDVDEDAAACTNTAVKEKKEKKVDRKTDVTVETNVDDIEKKKKKKSKDIVTAKRMKTDETSLFFVPKKKFEVDEIESIDIEEYQSKRKTVKKSKNNYSPVIDLDTLDTRGSRDNDHETNKPKEARKTLKRIKLMEEEEEKSDTDIALLAEIETINIADDEDAEDIKLEPIIEEKRSSEKETQQKTSPKKAETTRAKNKEEGESSSAQLPRKKTQTEKDKIDENPKAEWTECDYLCEFNQIEPRIAENLLTLFKNENTIPFIARYRGEMTGGMDAEKLRSVRSSYDNMKSVKAKALLISQNINKLGKLNAEINSAIMAAKTMHELELIYDPFKPETKGSHAERARELGLSQVADDIMNGKPIPGLDWFINPEREGLRDLAEVRRGVVHIIADVISKHKATLTAIRKIKKNKAVASIITNKVKTAATSAGKTPSNSLLQKFENYFKGSFSEATIMNHQILAINRGEKLKLLTVSVLLADWFQPALKRSFLSKNKHLRISHFHWNIMEESFDDAYVRLIKPSISRQLRQRLSERAANSSIEAFAKNLKNLLLTPPLRGKIVLGIDPGFVNGCKLAVVSPCGDVLETTTIYPHISSRDRGNMKRHADCLANLVKKHDCDVVALGSGTACRETEQFLTDLIQEGAFAPIDLSYTIVDEAGASIYSCSKEAKSEFPNLDPNLISAVSIARRLQDPLAELVKVDPKHLGVGMYQHDLPQKQLEFTLNEVIIEIVSFVGVDVNTASQCLLKKVAGLTKARAANIIKHRTDCGPFTSRQNLIKVPGIGPKTFEQCAGFIRILPETASIKGVSSAATKCLLDCLDQTWIHPESYNVARKFLKACGCSPNEIGTDDFIQEVLSFVKNRDRKILADEFGTSKTTMDVIIEGLSMKKGEDIRIDQKLAPLFHKNLRSIDDLKINTRVTGSIRNVTDFGAFVDIGIGPHGLIPSANIQGKGLTLGQKVEVLVLSIDKVRGRVVLNI